MNRRLFLYWERTSSNLILPDTQSIFEAELAPFWWTLGINFEIGEVVSNLF